MNLSDIAWRAGDYRPRCEEKGHLICRGCQACACFESNGGLGASLSDKMRVTTDSEGHTWCQECRYEVREYGNLRDGDDVDDRRSAGNWRQYRMDQRRRGVA